MTVKKVIFLIPVLILILISGFLSIYQIYYSDKFFAGVKVAGIDLSGKTYPEAYQKLQNSAAFLKSESIGISDSSRSYLIPSKNIKLEILIDQSLLGAWAVGRQSNPFASLVDQTSTIFGAVNIPASYRYDKNIFDLKIDQIATVLNSQPIEPSIIIIDNRIDIKPGQKGKFVEKELILAQFESNIARLNHGYINLAVAEVEPKISNKQAQKYLSNLNNLVGKKVTLSFGDIKKELTDVEIASYLSLDSSKKALISIDDWAIYNISPAVSKTEDQFSAFVDDTKISELTRSIASDIDQLPKNAQFVFENGKVSTFQPAVEGRQVDQQKLLIDLGKSIILDPSKNVVINIPVKISQPSIKTEDVNTFGIKELIGRGASNFSGSAAERVNNIKLASSRINGTLITPGEIFSFNQTVGEISAASGYSSAYIISKGRTILGEGGGVCQVSTTIFRAAVYSGLGLVERHAHAYRVAYYEKGGHKVGLDATIYSPSVDLKFKNDTGNYILVQSYIKGLELFFDFYGTKDGREILVSNPSVSNVIPAPEELNEPDPTLPAGTKKQVDFAAVGATVSVKRTVTKGGQILYNDNFYSRYRPWQAIYKIGTGGQV